MIDRAANEKKSNKILNEWRDEELASNISNKVHNAVESFHCWLASTLVQKRS